LGGGLVRIKILMLRVKKIFPSYLAFPKINKTRIAFSKLQEKAQLLGAALL